MPQHLTTYEDQQLSAARIAFLLSQRGFEIPVACFAATESTQDEARAALVDGAPHGSVFVAEHQRHGRGRRGRRWISGVGALLFSIVIHDAWSKGSTWPVVAAAVATLSAAESEEGVTLQIKWPNDLVFGERKAAGILVEAVGPDAVLGVGINVNDAPGIADGTAAVSLAEIAGRRLDRSEILVSFVAQILETLALPMAARGAVHALWEARSAVRGVWVELSGSGWRKTGRVEGFGPQGELLLRTSGGVIEVITVGDITVRPTPRY